MTTRELLTEALNGGTPDTTPLSFYSWMVPDITADPVRRLLDQGMGLCHHCPVVKHVEHGVKNSEEERIEGHHRYRTYRKETPVGTIQRVTLNGWHHEDWLKTPQDYKARQWIVENTELVTDYEAFERAEAEAGDCGVAVVTGSRTPAMSINVDWAGTQQFCMDVAIELDELMALFQAEKEQFLEETRLIAAGPGRFVKWFENLTISMLGPQRYEDLLVSVYNEAVPILDAADKRVMVHYDGGLKVIADHIARAPFHMVESLTEPPEGDMTYDECRAAWPDKVLWANVNVDLYHAPEAELRDAIAAKRERAGKQGFAFEISEDWPDTWETCMPIMLDTLRELR
jgi:dihydroneopterin aldolase